MANILIVDDEEIIRNNLKNKIDWTDDLTWCAEAKDGIEALELALNLRPDIVITDVRMPQMNGIEFITELKKILPDIQTIFISGYNEFEYVKSALELESCAYVLKPIKKQELNEAVQKALQKIQHNNLLCFTSQMQLNLLDKHLESLYNGMSISLADFETILVDLHFHTAFYQLLLVRFIDAGGSPDVIAQTLTNTAAFLAPGYTSRILPVSQTNFAVFLTSAQPVDLLWFGKNLIKQLSIKHSLDISIVLGRQSDSVWDVPDIFKEAKDSLNLLHLYSVHEIILPQQKSDANKSFIFPDMIARDIIDNIYTGNMALLNNSIEKLNQFIQENSAITLYQINHIFSQLLSDILRILYERRSSKALIDQGISLMHSFSVCSVQEDFTNQFLLYCEAIISSFKKNTSIEEMMHQTEAYIQAHYKEDISLKKIASLYYLNISYFSLSFKNVTGTNFNEYLTNVRMENAKKLLSNPSIKISQIAQLVGYDDTSYFGKTFRKRVGMLPSEYRKQILSQ